MFVHLLTLGLGAYATTQGGESGAGMQALGYGIQAVSNYTAGMARAGMSEADAAAEEAVGQVKAQRIRTAGRRELAGARAAAVASGVRLDSGSVLEAERELVANVEIDAMSAILSGANAAAGLRASADQYKLAGQMGAAESLLHAGNAWKRTRKPEGWDGILRGTRGTGD